MFKLMGFEVNPYDPCMATKVINGSQMMLRWHGDNIMISHANAKEINLFLWDLKDIYGDN
jgi:hypothetical protein